MGTGFRQAALALALAACGGSSSTPTSTSTPTPTSTSTSTSTPTTTSSDDEEIVIAAVQQAVNANNAGIHDCWARAAADDFRLSGRVVVEVEIAAGGAVKGTRVVEDQTGDTTLTACLTELWGKHPWPAEAFAEARLVQLPMEFGAQVAQYVVAASHAPRVGQGVAVLTPENTGNDSVHLALLNVSAPIAPHRHEVTELLYVVSGEGELVASKPRKLAPGDAVFVAPGVMHGLRGGGKDGLVVIELHAPAGAERLKDAPTTSGPAPRLRGAAPITRATAKAKTYAIAGGKGKATILFDAQTAVDDAASLVALTLDGGVTIPLHRHEGSTEVLYLFEGKGVMTVAGQDIPVAAGDAIQIPSGVEHGFQADASGPVKALQSYVPGGPEQRFKGPTK
ncbi:MAG TPA: cupin domain-containing protein [Kofleriaceae bacterium]|nr:cupin domain-containing protein [Kofleriaceae bacterium]